MACEKGIDGCAKCEHEAIPSRLHASGRPVIDVLPSGGAVYMHHDALAADVGDGMWLKYRGLNQSVIAEELNSDGDPHDVLWDTRTGSYQDDKIVVKFSLDEIRQIEFPDKNLLRRDPKSGAPLPFEPEDYFSFDARHDPVPCMYPHCEIRAIRDGSIVERMSKGMQNITREWFQRIAQVVEGCSS